jgi:hypothetical protein
VCRGGPSRVPSPGEVVVVRLLTVFAAWCTRGFVRMHVIYSLVHRWCLKSHCFSASAAGWAKVWLHFQLSNK